MIPHPITRQHILEAIKRIDAEGVPAAHQSTKFDLLYEGNYYPPKYVLSLAHVYVNGKELSHKDFSGGDEANRFLKFRGFTVVKKGDGGGKLVEHELDYRKRMWTSLLEKGNPVGVKPTLLRELGIYGGAQGVWVDKTRTAKLTEDGTGVAVGLLHTGTSYADDISEDAVLYHYPNTNRPKARDKSEIDATKAAGRLGLPVFVIKYPTPNSTRREVHLGWVEDWDDEAGIFLISFGDAPTAKPGHGKEDDERPFEPFANQEAGKRLVKIRKGQQKFKFDVIKRYGAQCAVCSIDFIELLDGAHIIPNKAAGSYDARNGLVLCASHHRAFDAGLFAIEPNTLKVHLSPNVPDKSSLLITLPTLEHLPLKPHVQALEWHWQRWQKMT